MRSSPGVVFGCLAAVSVVGAVLNFAQGHVFRLVVSLGWAVIFGELAFVVAVQLRRNIAAWDDALRERRQVDAAE